METATRINVYPESDEIKLHFYQSEIMRSKARFLGLISGTGGGKTFTGPIWLDEQIYGRGEYRLINGKEKLIRQIEGYPTNDFMMVAPVTKMLESRSLPALLEYLDKQNRGYVLKEQKGQIELDTGGKIFIRSADKPETLEGPTLRAVWADEAGQMKRKTWQVLQRRVGFLQGRILLTTTPYAKNWLYKDVFKRWQDGEEDYFCVQFPSIVNREYAIEEYERAKRELPPEDFAMFYDGKFISKTGLVFKEFRKDHIIDPFPIPKDWRITAGIDWGYNHPFVFSLWGVNKENVHYNFAEYYAKEKQIDEHALEIKNMIGDWHVVIYPDPENPQAMQDLKEALYRLGCFNFTMKTVKREGKEWVMDGIRYMKSLMWQNKFFVFANCENIIRELGLYRYLRNIDGEKIDRPVMKDDDCISAGRYNLFSSKQTALQFYIGGGE